MLLHKPTPTNSIALVQVYPSAWKENGVVVPIIDVKVLDQVREGSYLDIAEGDEKNALDTETFIVYFELPPRQGNFGDEDVVYISFNDSQKYAYLAECKELTKGVPFSEITVFAIEQVIKCQA